MSNYYQSKNDQLKMQEDRINEQKDTGMPFLFIGGEQFFASMQNVGYLDEAQAIADIVDNSVEAGATKIDVKTLRETPAGEVQSIAIVDNGCGMSEEWLEASIAFGNTSRGKSRSGLGRYGMGLSSAGIAFGDLLEVYSKVEGGVWNKTFIDLQEGSETKFTDTFLAKLKFQPPKATEQNPPEWAHPGQEPVSGTVVILSALSHQKRKIGPRNFASDVSEHLGITYHKMEGDFELTVDGEPVWFIDPLFLTPGMKGYDLDDFRAIEKQDSTLDFDVNGKDLGSVRFRTSYMPPQFGLKQEFQEIRGTRATGKFANSRFKILRKYTGIIIVRNGRVIAVDKEYQRFGNNDYNIGVMVEFSGKADEYFGLTTLKNALSLKDETKALFDKIDIAQEIKNVRSERDKLFSDWNPPKDMKVKDKKGNLVTAAEFAAAQQAATPRHKPDAETAKIIKEEGEKNFNKEVERLAKKENKTTVEAAKELTAKLVGKPSFATEILPLRGAEFISFSQSGFQTVMEINSDHLFYKYLYGSEHVSAFGKMAVQNLLFSLSEALKTVVIGPVDAGKSLRASTVQRHLLSQWSKNLDDQLTNLAQHTKPDEADFDDTEPPQGKSSEAEVK
jgi:hypothetical protein